MEVQGGLLGKGSNGYKSDKYEQTARGGKGGASWTDAGFFLPIEFIGFIHNCT